MTTPAVKVRPFSWRDFIKLQQLLPHVLYLDSQSAFIGTPPPMLGALHGYLAISAPVLPLFAELENEIGATQILFPSGGTCAHLHFLAAENEVIGRALISQAIQQVGEREYLYLMAECAPDQHIFEWLRHSGFSIIARQTIFELPAQTRLTNREVGQHKLRRVDSGDALALFHFCHDVTPRLLQQVEWPRLDAQTPEGWLLEHHGEILAYWQVRLGAKGIFAKLFLHPQADVRIDGIIEALLAYVLPHETRPLAVCVRSHQSWMDETLMRYGFRVRGEQAVLVKRLVQMLPAQSVPLPQMSPLQT